MLDILPCNENQVLGGFIRIMFHSSTNYMQCLFSSTASIFGFFFFGGGRSPVTTVPFNLSIIPKMVSIYVILTVKIYTSIFTLLPLQRRCSHRYRM